MNKHKHQQNMERLCKKMRFRYGDNDDLVMQLKHELAALEARKTTASALTSQRLRAQDSE
ncbi:hypothetical protein [Polaromonas sp.]|uniref:hypothetical protein n=1 Tax=Polaromonas sp. TaxID=1869339 RepID=UPI003BB66927